MDAGHLGSVAVARIHRVEIRHICETPTMVVKRIALSIANCNLAQAGRNRWTGRLGPPDPPNTDLGSPSPEYGRTDRLVP